MIHEKVGGCTKWPANLQFSFAGSQMQTLWVSKNQKFSLTIYTAKNQHYESWIKNKYDWLFFSLHIEMGKRQLKFWFLCTKKNIIFILHIQIVWIEKKLLTPAMSVYPCFKEYRFQLILYIKWQLDNEFV